MERRVVIARGLWDARVVALRLLQMEMYGSKVIAENAGIIETIIINSIVYQLLRYERKMKK